MTKNFEVITDNMEWAKRIGMKFASLHPELDVEDVLQESMLAHLEAVKTYEPYGSYQGYAYRRIWCALEKAFVGSSNKSCLSIDVVNGSVVLTVDTGIDTETFFNKMFQCLSERERLVVIRSFKDGKTLKEIAVELWPDCRYNKERVRQILAKALWKMRRYATASGYCYDDFE